VTAVLDEQASAPASGTQAPDRPASWPARAGAFAVDVFLGLGVVATMALVALSAPWGGWLWWSSIMVSGLVILSIAVNRLLLPVITGWSLGRALFGIAVQGRNGGIVGPWRLLARDVAHLLDTAALFIGWLWPQWDSRGRTFADLLLRTEVRRVERPQQDMRRPTAAVMIAAALLSVAAVGLSYLVVYRHDKAVDEATKQIKEQGPRIVEEMLTYSPNTLQQDFSHAQSLATDSYRPQLVAQQQVVQKAGAQPNEYWTATNTVLSASPDRASMLLLMQGQRGAGTKDLRFITATVRVDFARSSGQPWRVNNMTVLTKPMPNGAAK
jgi:Mce-associated membrane protein